MIVLCEYVLALLWGENDGRLNLYWAAIIYDDLFLSIEILYTAQAIKSIEIINE